MNAHINTHWFNNRYILYFLWLPIFNSTLSTVSRSRCWIEIVAFFVFQCVCRCLEAANKIVAIIFIRWMFFFVWSSSFRSNIIFHNKFEKTIESTINNVEVQRNKYTSKCMSKRHVFWVIDLTWLSTILRCWLMLFGRAHRQTSIH